ncbi:hypothetical protein GCM10009717_04120 [Agromyces allii]|uniref:Uncharacterized protein n=1 Tax=Agromyces allii TaxID=393607 RepID=A0ABN2Q1K9_9MICO
MLDGFEFRRAGALLSPMDPSAATATRSAALAAWGLTLLIFGALGFIGGPALIATFYASQGRLPIADIGSWNTVLVLFVWLSGLVLLATGILLLVLGRRR